MKGASVILPILRAARGLTNRAAVLFFDSVSNRPAVQRPDGSVKQLAFTTDGGGAPTTADYLVKTANGSLSAERVVTDTASVVWDWATGGQAKATVPDMVGDSGSGGTAGLVPAPAAGDGAAARVLHADGTWALPQSAGRVYYLDPADASDIASHYTARTSPSTTAESMSSSALTGTSATLIYAFATESGEPGIILLPPGTALRHFHAATGASNQVATLTIEVWTCASDGSGAVLRRSNTSESFSGTSVREITSAEVDPSGYTMASTDRLLIKVYGARVSGPATCNLDVYWNGTARAPFVTSTIMQPASGGQPLDATLTAWAAAGSQGLPYFSAVDTVATLTLAADRGVYATGAGALATYDLSSFARTLLDDTTATAARTTLEVTSDTQFVSANFFPLAMVGGGQASSTSTITTNRYYRWPWVAPRTGTIDLFVVEVTAGSGLSKGVVALWSDSAGALGAVLGESGELSFATPNGNKTGAPASAISVTQGTLYWVTMIGVSGASIRSFAAADWRGPMGYPLAGGGYPSSRYEVTQTYANPTPAWPAGEIAANTASFRPCAFFRWAT